MEIQDRNCIIGPAVSRCLDTRYGFHTRYIFPSSSFAFPPIIREQKKKKKKKGIRSRPVLFYLCIQNGHIHYFTFYSYFFKKWPSILSIFEWQLDSKTSQLCRVEWKNKNLGTTTTTHLFVFGILYFLSRFYDRSRWLLWFPFCFLFFFHSLPHSCCPREHWDSIDRTVTGQWQWPVGFVRLLLQRQPFWNSPTTKSFRLTISQRSGCLLKNCVRFCFFFCFFFWTRSVLSGLRCLTLEKKKMSTTCQIQKKKNHKQGIINTWTVELFRVSHVITIVTFRNWALRSNIIVMFSL